VFSLKKNINIKFICLLAVLFVVAGCREKEILSENNSDLNFKTGVISGRVQDTLIFPPLKLKSTSIILSGIYFKDTLLTSKEGTFKFKGLLKGFYSVRANKQNRISFDTLIFLNPPDSIQLSINLKSVFKITRGILLAKFNSFDSTIGIFNFVSKFENLSILALNNIYYYSNLPTDSIVSFKEQIFSKEYLIVSNSSVSIRNNKIVFTAMFVNPNNYTIKDWNSLKNRLKLFHLKNNEGEDITATLKVPEGKEIKWFLKLKNFSMFVSIGIKYNEPSN